MPYNAAKWSLMAFQEEWVNTHAVNAQSNIQIVTILPGTVNTSLGYTGIFGEHPLSFQYCFALIAGGLRQAP